MSNGMDKHQLQRLARLGAHARLQQLEEERRAILRAFPGISQAGRQRKATDRGAGEPARQAKPRRRRRVTAAQKKAQSQRMKAIWAERKKAEAKD